LRLGSAADEYTLGVRVSVYSRTETIKQISRSTENELAAILTVNEVIFSSKNILWFHPLQLAFACYHCKTNVTLDISKLLLTFLPFSDFINQIINQ